MSDAHTPHVAADRLIAAHVAREAALERVRLANEKWKNLDAQYREAKDAKASVMLESRTIVFSVSDERVRDLCVCVCVGGFHYTGSTNLC